MCLAYDRYLGTPLCRALLYKVIPIANWGLRSVCVRLARKDEIAFQVFNLLAIMSTWIF